MTTRSAFLLPAIGGALFLVPNLPLLEHGMARAQEMAPEIIAVQIRKQGYACGKAESAKRDNPDSAPDEAAWILTCDDAKYRVRLIPDMAAEVERLPDSK